MSVNHLIVDKLWHQKHRLVHGVSTPHCPHPTPVRLHHPKQVVGSFSSDIIQCSRSNETKDTVSPPINIQRQRGVRMPRRRNPPPPSSIVCSDRLDKNPLPYNMNTRREVMTQNKYMGENRREKPSMATTLVFERRGS